MASLRMKTLMMLQLLVPTCLTVKERGVRSVARARLPKSEGDTVAWDFKGQLKRCGEDAAYTHSPLQPAAIAFGRYCVRRASSCASRSMASTAVRRSRR